MVGYTCPNRHQFSWTEVLDVSLQNLDDIFESNEIDQVQMSNSCNKSDEISRTKVKNLDVLDDILQLPHKERSFAVSSEALSQIGTELTDDCNLLPKGEILLGEIDFD